MGNILWQSEEDLSQCTETVPGGSSLKTPGKQTVINALPRKKQKEPHSRIMEVHSVELLDTSRSKDKMYRLPSPVRTQGDGMEQEKDYRVEMTGDYNVRGRSHSGCKAELVGTDITSEHSNIVQPSRLDSKMPEVCSLTPENNSKSSQNGQTKPVLKISNKLNSPKENSIEVPFQAANIPLCPPQHKIINLVPKTIGASKREKFYIGNIKAKEPKFVPYEPYKAATKPIIPARKKSDAQGQKLYKNLDFADTKISSDGSVMMRDDAQDRETDDGHFEEQQENEETEAWEVERKELQEEIHALKEEKKVLSDQLKIQVEVNAELKKLLVASVGEDMEARVQFLTEDKAKLAHDIVCYSAKLCEDYEEKEKLSIHCDVWRSKFLASSLMVDELARWKAVLCRKYDNMQEALRMIRDEHAGIRKSLLNTYSNLQTLKDSFDPLSSQSSKKNGLSSSNLIDLSSANQNLSNRLKFQLLGTSRDGCNQNRCPENLDTQTPGEKLTEQLLSSYPQPHLSLTDELVCHAVSGSAGALGAHLFSHSLGARSDWMSVSCCAHCSGEVKQL